MSLFHKLDSAVLPGVYDGASLDSLLLEEEMKGYNGGVSLGDIRPNHLSRAMLFLNTLGNRYASYVPMFLEDHQSDEYHAKARDLGSLHPEVKEPCSMIVHSDEELSWHMSVAYQVSHIHYIMGKRQNMKGSFPYDCCGRSSRNVMLSLIHHGYLNATYAYCSERCHGYTILPFVFPEKGIEGVILIDPTCDQLDDGETRNIVMLKLGSSWCYDTEWGNLFPQYLLSVDRLHRIGDDICALSAYHTDAKSFLRNSYSNPIELKLP